ncbi:hypothetical protein PV325_012915, partial [Microctonus aethiopoides]
MNILSFILPNVTLHSVHCSLNLLSLVATHGVQDGRIAKTTPSLYLSDVTAPTDSETPLAGTLVSRARTK